MSTPNISYTNTELAELFDFLTSVGLRSASGENTPSMDSIPKGLAPVFRRLSQTFDKRDLPSTRPRRDTVASVRTQKDTDIEDVTMMSDGDESDDADDASLADFSRADAKRFPFAFRHPIHKLYRKADWARTVQETIEMSRNQYKPLAEQVVYAGAPEDQENEVPLGKDDGAVRFKIPISPVTARTRRSSVVSGFGGRERRESIASSVSAAAAFRPQSPTASPYNRSAYPRSPTVQDHPEVRALKKRVLGRRKSISGLQSNQVAQEEGGSRGAWVYDAAVSASERPASANFTAFPPAPPPSPTDKPRDTKYGALGMKNLPSTLQGAAGSKRRVSASGLGMIGVPMLMPLNQVTGKDRLVSRRRAAAMAFDLEDEGRRVIERNSAKRPFMD